MHSGLPGRVGATDDVDVLVGAVLSLSRTGPVVHAAPSQLVQAGPGEAAVGDTGRENDSVRADAHAVVKDDAVLRAGAGESDNGLRRDHLGAELECLEAGSLRELRPGHPVRESEVVLDPRALPCLTSGSGPL